MTPSTLCFALLALAMAVPAGSVGSNPRGPQSDVPEPEKQAVALQVHYLEIVTPELDETCSALAKLHTLTFADPAPELGNARTAKLRGVGLVGVRAPLRADEEPVVRPYVLVDDIATAVEEVEAAGGQIALPPTEIEGRGRCAICFQGGIQHGLWEL